MAHSQSSTEEVQLVPADSNASHNKTVIPKTIVLHRISNSFGFTLRHFVVYPPEVIRSSNETCTVNGIDNEPCRGQQIDTIFVRQVSPNGPADKAGLSSGDQVVSVNGIHTLNKSYKQVIELIQKSHVNLELGIIPKEECILQVVSPVMTVCHQPPTKPKPSEPVKPLNISSAVTIAPSQPSPSESSAALMVSISDPPDSTQITRRRSLDRHAQENRNYVVANKYNEVNNNSEENRKSNQSKGPASSGTYFFATTDYTGKPKALHFQRGTNLDQLQVVNQGKARSKSLSSGEMDSLNQNWQDKHKHPTAQQNGPQASPNETSLEIKINQPGNKPVLSSRIVASDSPSTVNVSTNSDFISRQPVAREPKKRPNTDESSSFLVRTISSHMNQERRSSGFQSSTVGATLLESHPTNNADFPQPNKTEQQTSQLSVYTNQNVSGQIQLSLSNESVEGTAADKNQHTFEEKQAHKAGTSPRHRRTSYLMATNANKRTKTESNGDVVKKMPTLSSALFSTPEIGKDTPKEEISQDEDEIFVDCETDIDSATAPRIGRRISYVMATSSTTPRVVLEGMKEEDEQPTECVSGIMEVIKEGFLWKKLLVGDGGKRSSVRSWKAVYCVLRGHVLYFHKDRDSAHHTKMGEGGDEQQPISIKTCIVDIAHDYTKRKNVFRLTTFNGCEYLFQCEDRSSMMQWIKAIQSNNNPDEDVSGVTSQSLIIRRMRNVEQESTGTSHSSGHKLTPTPSSAKIPNFSNLKKSLSFKNISGIQNKEEGSKKWNRSGKKRKKQSPNMVNYVQGHSVGAPLEMCPMSKGNKSVPMLVEHCCEVVDNKGIDCVGVYRVPGNSAAVSLLQDEVNNKGADNVNFGQEKWHDINNITSLLKQFLRKLPEGLVTADLYEGFIEANKKEDPVERMWALKCLINELPEHNYETLKFLLAHLKRISDNAETNKMEARNLAIVFGPTLVRTGEDTMISMVKDMSDQCRIVETLLTHNDWFFEESGDGDEPPSKPPVTTAGQDHFVSMSVLSSLGQAAGNFGEDGNIKPKFGGGLSHISLHIPKFRGRPSKSESHDSSSPEPVMSDGSVSPTLERGGLPQRAAAGSCPGSPTQERHRLAPKRNTDLTSLSTGSITPAFESVDDSKLKGTSSLKAYSYARPPPPSYRKAGPQRGMNQASEPGPETMPVCVTFTGPSTPESEIPPKFDNDHEAENHPSKPSFASLSEETRLRLLKVSLHQKAMEKKRKSESSSPGLSPPPSAHFDTTDDSQPQKETEHFGSNEHLSSSNTSQSSSTPSSKTASLDSLHQPPNESLEVRKMHPSLVTSNSGWKASTLQSTGIATTPSVETSETVVNVIQGKCVKNNVAEAKRRPSSSDIRARRNTAEGLRVRPSLQSESSDSSSEDEASELQQNMSKTFNEKLKILLDVNHPITKSSERKGDVDDTTSIAIDQSRKLSLDKQRRPSTDNRQRRPSDSYTGRRLKPSESDRLSFQDVRSKTGIAPVSNSERRSSFDQKPEKPRRVSVDGTETRTTIQIESKPRKASTDKIESTDTRTPDRHSLSETTKTVINFDVQRKNSHPGSEQPMMGRVRTATPVALKEFNIASATFRKDLAGAGQKSQSRKFVHKDSPIVKAKTEESSITISPRSSAYGSPARSPRSSISDASPRNSFGESPRNSRSEVNINLARTQKLSQSDRKNQAQKKPPPEPERKHLQQTGRKYVQLSERRPSAEQDRKSLPREDRKSGAQEDSRTLPQTERKQSSQSESKPLSSQTERKPPSKYAAMAARHHHVPSKVTSRDFSAKPKTFPLDGGQHRAILPSKGRQAYKEHGKLETNAQHIAELLEEMHSERLKMMRQRSDISGQAQKAAAQRAAIRRRRRSVGDENEPNSNEMEDAAKTKDSLLKTTSDVARYKWSAENDNKPQHTSYKTHSGNAKKGKDRKN